MAGEVAEGFDGEGEIGVVGARADGEGVGFGAEGTTGEGDKDELAGSEINRFGLWFKCELGSICGKFGDFSEGIRVARDEPAAQEGAVGVGDEGECDENYEIPSQGGVGEEVAADVESVERTKQKGEAEEFMGEMPDAVGDFDEEGDGEEGDHEKKGDEAQEDVEVVERKELLSGEFG